MEANRNSPVLLVQPRDTDLHQREYGAFGEPKELVPVTPKLRKALCEKLDEARTVLAASFKDHPSIPATLRLRLRIDGLAKSHRPMELLQRVDMLPIGAGKLGDLFIPATPNSIKHLTKVIAESTAKKIKANISAIDAFEPYTKDDVLGYAASENAKKQLADCIKEKRPLVLERFTSTDADTDAAIVASISNALRKTNATQIGGNLCAGHHSTMVISTPSLSAAQALATYPGIRAITPAPMVSTPEISAQWFSTIGPAAAGLPTVAVVDTGISSKTTLLKPWIAGRETYLLPPETDNLHGTFVSALVCGARHLNNNDTAFPAECAKVLDVAALGLGRSTSPADMIERLRESLKKHPDVKVWNCSFNTSASCSDNAFGYLARELDTLADQHGVLFVISAGNFNPPRPWPNPPDYNGNDRISDPADAIRALTIGSVAHLPALVQPGEPSPFSRRGPGPAKTPKPDITHHGGNCDNAGTFGGAGVRSILEKNVWVESIGTSFSAPLASALAANVWQSLEQQKLPVRADMVKALLIHAAALNAPIRTPAERHYHGFGLPKSVLDTLFCRPDTFTLMFDAELFDGQIWEKTPFPIPACLHPGGKKLRADVTLTLVYSPPLDARHGAEYVRANVNAHFGSYDPDADGELKFHGFLPISAPDKHDLYEEAMVDHGFKWSPVKVYRKRFKLGKAGERFRLSLDLLRRAGEPPRREPQRAIVLISFRALDETTTEVYNDGIRAANAINWITHRVATVTRVRT